MKGRAFRAIAGKAVGGVAVLLLLLTVAVGQGQPDNEAVWEPPRTPDGQPDIQGYWTNGGSIATAGIEGVPDQPNAVSVIVDPPDGKIPYQPWAAAKQRENQAYHLSPEKKDLEFMLHWDSETRCLPVGVPRINYATPYNGYQIFQRPGSVIIFAEWNHTYRIIPLDGRPHVGRDIRLWMGDSRGRWEGNTLVVDVTNFTDRTWFDELGHFHGEELHVVERYTFADPETIAYEATIEDPAVFTRPWSLALSFKRATGGDGTKLWAAGQLEEPDDQDAIQSPIWFKDVQSPTYQLFEYACHEGNKAISNIYGSEVYRRILDARRPLSR